MADRDPNPDFAGLLRAFVDADVRFLIVGAYALGAHGHVRATGDLDLPRKHFRIRAARLVVALAVFSSVALAGGAAADLSCTPRYGGGFDCR
jgi:hypothetical protein